jgi:hypothetical protein
LDRAESAGQEQAIAQGLLRLTGAMRDQATQLWPMVFRGTGVGIGDSTAMLLGVSMLDSTAPVEVSELIHSSVQLGFFGYLNRAGYRNCLKVLLANWIPKTHDALAPEVMRIAFDLDLEIILPIAEKHLAASFDKTTREFAIFCIAKFGQPSNVPELLKFIGDTTVVYEFDDTSGGIIASRRAPPGIPVDAAVQFPHKLVRINDLAAAAAMILLNEDPSKVFPRITKEQFLQRSLTGLAVDEEDVELRNYEISAWAAEHLSDSLDG